MGIIQLLVGGGATIYPTVPVPHGQDRRQAHASSLDTCDGCEFKLFVIAAATTSFEPTLCSYSICTGFFNPQGKTSVLHLLLLVDSDASCPCHFSG